MLEILVWIGCAIIVLLGFIALQIGLVADEKAKGWTFGIGCTVLTGAIITAVIFMIASEEQVAAMSGSLAGF